jgi:Rrf2 family transcriptional regulator, iron-sulfur cluster assembly transcription factor
MKISSQEEYGLRCLIQVARDGSRQPLPISEIAMQEGLSVEYVGKLLMKLRKGGLVDSVRGKAGGYVLALPANEITLKIVFDVFSEPIYDPGYCERFSGTEKTCVHVAECGIRPIWSIVNRFLAQALAGVSVADLIESESIARRRLRESLRDQALSIAAEEPALGPPQEAPAK